ncbi:hypothetical protein EH223_17755 [candidate division KSB1 bacterium]|nr:hypothetical protein [candidate division KSB1 bacterium]RQW00595.1 MAG: hypothetical protein EH223_17755 [candidate division KSB1 bacterium]
MKRGLTNKTVLFSIFGFWLLSNTGQTQTQFGDRTYGGGNVVVQEESYFTKPIQLIDMPTASILRGGAFRASTRIYEQGGVLASLSAGVSNKVMFGVSYGGLDIIGNAQKIIWNPMPGVHFVYRITEESMKLPAIIIGFDSQGYGPHYPESSSITLPDTTSECPQIIPPPYNEKMFDRYQFKSRGFYCVVSKGYASFVNAGLHAGVSYTLDKGEDEDTGPTIFMGSDIHVARDLAFLVEYDFALNDNKVYARGVFNFGVRWAFGRNMFFDFDMQNVLGTAEGGKTDYRRIIKLTYYGSILR